LVHTGRMSLPALVARFTTGPAKLLRLPKGTLRVGSDADVTVFDPQRDWVFSAEDSASKSKNSPFHSWSLKGKAVATIVSGKMAWSETAESVPSC